MQMIDGDPNMEVANRVQQLAFSGKNNQAVKQRSVYKLLISITKKTILKHIVKSLTQDIPIEVQITEEN